MRSFIATLAASAAMTTSVMGHATFQQLWINGEDQGTTCARLPTSNSPIASVETADIRCNANPNPASGTCPVVAGDTVTVEMHQHDSRACTEEAIGGAHRGPVLVYLSKVADAARADGSDPFFKIFESGYDAATGKWGNDVLNDNCGKQDVTIPADIEAGDYILRAETIALHAAGSEGGAQPYVTCYQITVTGGGSATPEGVLFPGAYSPTDPGIMINIYADFGSYVIPGPEVYEAGSDSGSGSPPASSAVASSAAPTAPTAVSSTAAPTSSGFTTSVAAVPTSAAPVESASATTSAVSPEETSGSTLPETFTLDTFIAWLQEKASA